MATKTAKSAQGMTEKLEASWKTAPQWARDEAWAWYKAWTTLLPHRAVPGIGKVVDGIESDLSAVAPMWKEFAGLGTAQVRVSGPAVGVAPALVAVPVLVLFLAATIAAVPGLMMPRIRDIVRKKRAERARELDRWRKEMGKGGKGRPMGPGVAAALSAAGTAIALLLASPTVSRAAGGLMWVIIAGLGAWLLITRRK